MNRTPRGCLGLALAIGLLLTAAEAVAGDHADRYVPRKLYGLLTQPGVVLELLEDQGGMDHWHRAWVVSGAESPTQVMAEAEASLHDPFLPAPAPWQKMEVAERPEDPPTSAWFLTDERGRYWEGLVRVRPDPAEPARLLVSVDIEQSHGLEHSSARSSQPDPRLRLGQARAGQAPPPRLDLSRERLSQNGRFRVRFEPQPGEVPSGLRHAWLLWVETPDGSGIDDAEIEAGGGRPGTGQPLPGAQSVTGGDQAGVYVVEGMEFTGEGDQPTWWEVRFLIRAGVAEDVVIFNLFVPERREQAGA
jgi:hypothetical protein